MNKYRIVEVAGPGHAFCFVVRKTKPDGTFYDSSRMTERHAKKLLKRIALDCPELVK